MRNSRTHRLAGCVPSLTLSYTNTGDILPKPVPKRLITTALMSLLLHLFRKKVPKCIMGVGSFHLYLRKEQEDNLNKIIMSIYSPGSSPKSVPNTAICYRII